MTLEGGGGLKEGLLWEDIPHLGLYFTETHNFHRALG